MGHDEEKERDPEYWDRIHNILSPLILDTLERDLICTNHDRTDSIKLDDVVSNKSCRNRQIINLNTEYCLLEISPIFSFIFFFRFEHLT